MNQPRLVGGRYQLLEQLGRGGMGIVWRAHDTMIGREVAVKQVLIPPNLSPADQAALRHRTLHEARAAAGIRHPAVVGIHDVIDDGGQPWIVMELVRGRSLDQAVKTGGPMSAAWAASVGLFVLSALASAHTRGLLHRDVKPGNVLLADDGRILLSDFGIAAPTGAAAQQGGVPVGTAGFTAPECLTEGVAPGPPSDLFSLGATIYTAVEGVQPFQRNTAMATLGAVMTEPPRPPQRAGELAPLLLGLLAKDPVHRPDVRALRRGLERVAGHAAATVRTPAPAWVVSRAAAYGSAAAVVVAFVVAVTLILTTGSSATPSPRPTPAAARTTKPAPSKAPTSAAPTASASASASASSSPAATLPAGKFSKMPRPCQLLTKEQATRLVGTFLTSSTDPTFRCTWATAGFPPAGKQLSVFLTLWLYPPQGDGYETTLAQEHVAGAKKEAEDKAGRGGTGEKQGEVFEIPGAGEEAIAYEISRVKFSNKHEVEVHVLFRTGNMVGEFRFVHDVAKDAALRDKAAQAAKFLAANLDAKAS
ncbi:serine/threonine-protein kinase [Nonomuraea sp. NPDC049141]|uniref:serine/threonine-protein kinase n=1 Tax=Nonomuraea sp. NPDC049141 TaxID=3155500 RepID=UPI0033D63FC1